MWSSDCVAGEPFASFRHGEATQHESEVLRQPKPMQDGASAYRQNRRWKGESRKCESLHTGSRGSPAQHSQKGCSGVLKWTAALLREADVRLLQFDKESGFVLASSDIYNEKADKAIAGNFKPVSDANSGKIKSRAIKLCEGARLTKFAASVRKTEGNTLSVFSAKPHKGE